MCNKIFAFYIYVYIRNVKTQRKVRQEKSIAVARDQAIELMVYTLRRM